MPPRKRTATIEAEPVAPKKAPAKRTPRKAVEPTLEEKRQSAREAAALWARKINARKGMAGTVVVASKQLPPPPRVTTGSLAFDLAMGGGFPANNWTEVVGQESHGKTTMVLKAIAANQKRNPDFSVIWVAAEPFDDSLAEMCGVDRDGVFLIETNIMEEAYQHLIDAMDDRAADMFVLDSYPALVATQEDEKDMEGYTMGGAKVTNQFIRKATKAGKRSLTDPDDRPFVGIFINQWREKIGVMHGDPRTTSGGKGKNYWCYCRLDVKRDEWIVNSAKEKVGQAIKIVVMKMKGARPQQIGVTDYYFADHDDFTAGEYDVFKMTVNLAVLFDVIQRSGSGYKGLEGQHIKSLDLLIQTLKSDVEWRARVEAAVLKGKAPVETEEEDNVVDLVADEDVPSARPRRRRKTV